MKTISPTAGTTIAVISASLALLLAGCATGGHDSARRADRGIRASAAQSKPVAVAVKRRPRYQTAEKAVFRKRSDVAVTAAQVNDVALGASPGAISRDGLPADAATAAGPGPSSQPVPAPSAGPVPAPQAGSRQKTDRTESAVVERATAAARRGGPALAALVAGTTSPASFGLQAAGRPAGKSSGAARQAREVAPATGQAIEPGSPAAQIEQAEMLLRIGNVLGAREGLEPLARAGHADAIAALGRTFDPNELAGLLAPPGVADPTRAIELYADAARRGSAIARARQQRLQAQAESAAPATAK